MAKDIGRLRWPRHQAVVNGPQRTVGEVEAQKWEECWESGSTRDTPVRQWDIWDFIYIGNWGIQTALDSLSDSIIELLSCTKPCASWNKKTKMTKTNDLPLKDYYLENKRFEGLSFTPLRHHESWCLCSDQFKWISLKTSVGDMTSNPVGRENRSSRTQTLRCAEFIRSFLLRRMVRRKYSAFSLK